MSRWVRIAVAILVALIGGAAGERYVFDNSTQITTDCSVHVSGHRATVRNAEITTCPSPDPWLAHIEALVEEVRGEIAEVETEIAEGE